MAEAEKPELLRYVKAHVALEIPHKFESAAERDEFIQDLAATYEKHGIRVGKGTFKAGTDETPGLMMKIPYGVADFY